MSSWNTQGGRFPFRWASDGLWERDWAKRLQRRATSTNVSTKIWSSSHFSRSPSRLLTWANNTHQVATGWPNAPSNNRLVNINCYILCPYTPYKPSFFNHCRLLLGTGDLKTWKQLHLPTSPHTHRHTHTHCLILVRNMQCWFQKLFNIALFATKIFNVFDPIAKFQDLWASWWVFILLSHIATIVTMWKESDFD